MVDIERVPTILECTLRDGSYAIDFKFTAKDTSLIAGALSEAGFELIEVGHGVGMGASEAGMGQASEADESYMKATASAVQKGRWGMFCIPGVARTDHVDMLADHGAGFVRIGANVTEVDAMKPFITHAKQRNLLCAANFMKSYASTPSEFVEVAKKVADWGVDVIYIVDSAGGMLPDEITAYIEATQEAVPVSLGFHGHNNLGLGTANALKAIELGVAIVDTSLQGIGRSSGNTPTEQLISAMERVGLDTGVGLIEVLDIGETLIRPLLSSSGHASIDTVMGFAQFHSSYMSIIRKFAEKYDVDPRRLIIAVTRRDRAHAPEHIVEEEARRLKESGDSFVSTSARFHFGNYHGAEEIISSKPK